MFIVSHLLTLQGLYGAIEGIWRAEVESTSEILQLVSFNVFPSAELTLIRRENKLFKDFVDQMQSSQNEDLVRSEITKLNEWRSDSLVAEQRYSDRKLGILRARRIEEVEAREAYERKLARARQAEEEQARDPANFSFQQRSRVRK